MEAARTQQLLRFNCAEHNRLSFDPGEFYLYPFAVCHFIFLHFILVIDGFSKRSLSAAMDVCVTPDDKRYFISETDDISNLETSVLESPRDAQLWIKLAFKYLSQKET